MLIVTLKKIFFYTPFIRHFRHLVSIVTSLYAAENGYLFIDEMDNGIHYSEFIS
jgi:AAA15 family ATPase/GTPase